MFSAKLLAGLLVLSAAAGSATVIVTRYYEALGEEASEGSCPSCCCANVTRAGLLARAASTAEEGPSPAVELKTIKLAQLLEGLAKHPGKLVVVDLWADFCLPCKRGFPHLVEMHQRFANDGLVCISVSVDEVKDQGAALKFLQKQQATFANYLLEDRAAVWQEHWNLVAIPAVFLYRDGVKIAQFDYEDPDKQFTYDDVEKAVVLNLKK